ncbi:MAG: STAS domain-containing protein, partial [Chloroflexota bacterium]|nr:STAS domain-containing protein [Chloroflexota bacterium]
MDVTIEKRDDETAIVSLTGRLDFVTAGVVRQRIVDTITDGHRRLVIDLASVPFIDSSGLGALIGGLKAARSAGGDLRIARAPEQMKVVLALT